MLPLLTYPLALIGLASLPALAAIYLLRNRFRKKTVSSLMLWHLQERSKEGGVKVQRVQFPLIFLLELLILALLVTAATGPRWQFGVNLRPLVVVLDDSASMLAVTDGKTSRDRAIESLGNSLRSGQFLNLRIVIAGANPRLAGPSLGLNEDLAATLQEWTSQAATSDLPAAIAFAREIARDDALILVLTDHPATDGFNDSPRLKWHSFGHASPNSAFVNAARSSSGGKDRVLLEVASFALADRKAELRITAGEKLIRKTTLDLATNVSRRIVLNLPTGTPAIIAALGDDVLAADNSVQLFAPVRKRVRVAVKVSDASFAASLNRVIDTTGLRSEIKSSPQIVFHDTPGIPAGTNTWSVRLISSEAAEPLTGPFVVDSSHPAANGLSLGGTIWAAAALTNDPGYLSLITSDRRPLLAVRRDLIGRQRLILNFTPQVSTVQQTPNWPVLFWNLLSWRRAEMPGLEEVNYRIGTDVRIRTQGDSILLTHPDGSVDELGVGEGEIIAPSQIPGHYRASAADGEWEYAVNFMAPSESDLRFAATGEWGQWEDSEETRKQYSSVLWLFVLLALTGIVGHHYLITHGKGTV